jgi:hypothetical protein
MSLRWAGDSALARAFPPLARLGAGLGLSSTSPVAILATMMAAPITSAGLRSPFGPLGMGGAWARFRRGQPLFREP